MDIVHGIIICNVRGGSKSPLLIQEIPWEWTIPTMLIGWTLEDIVNSQNHHYAM